MATKQKLEAQNPLILRSHRLMEAFAKSDDERDFYLDRNEGFIVYVDLDRSIEDLSTLEAELAKNHERYCMIPKLTFYETKKIMEGFVNEKVYDIDTKEKLNDIIQSKDARTNFLEFLYDHHSELDKWQQYYMERSRIRIIEWLRNNHFHFVFEEDLEMASSLVDKLKHSLFHAKAGKDVIAARKLLVTKAKTYYSNEALNPRPKRGRPPKQAVKQEIEPQVTTDIYTTVPSSVRPFLFTPDISMASASTFSTKFETQEQLNRRLHSYSDTDTSIESLNQKLATLRSLSTRWVKSDEKPESHLDFDLEEDEETDEEEDEEDFIESRKPKFPSKKSSMAKPTLVKEKKTQKIKPSIKKPVVKAKSKAKVKAKAKIIAKKPVVQTKSHLKKSTAKTAKIQKPKKVTKKVVVPTRKKNKRIIPVDKGKSLNARKVPKKSVLPPSKKKR